MAARYDEIGRTYAATRRPDPRIAALIEQAVDGGTVINIGAGTGSYEPPTTRLAIEPSATMIAQRPPGAAPCIQASAEALPVEDGSFDVALAVLTIHHWGDPDRGLAEMQRVARRQVVLTWDADVWSTFWLLHDYLPGTAAWDAARCPPIDRLVSILGPESEVSVVQIPHDCLDGFAGAFWRRPAAYLDPAVRAGISLFAQLAEEVEQGLERLHADLESRAWQQRNAGLLDLEELDLGYRLVGHLRS